MSRSLKKGPFADKSLICCDLDYRGIGSAEINANITVCVHAYPSNSKPNRIRIRKILSKLA